jgi:putative glutamine amidotransferase
MEKQTRPTIGIVGYPIDNHFGVGSKYLTFVRNIGNPRILLPTDDFMDLDLLILPGGPDIRIMEKVIPPFEITKSCPYRDYFDEYMLPQYIQSNTPIFGICRGHQTLANYFGCRIDNLKNHITSSQYNRSQKVHSLEFNKSKFAQKILSSINQEKKYKVNSLHHQGVFSDNEKYINLATAKNGYPEVMVARDYPVASVQYHPEELNDDLITNILIQLIMK